MNARRLTVSRHYPDSRAAAHRRLQRVTPMPFLRLQGRWLNEAGFAIGANVCVEVSAGRLVVELAEPAPPSRGVKRCHAHAAYRGVGAGGAER